MSNKTIKYSVDTNLEQTDLVYGEVYATWFERPYNGDHLREIIITNRRGLHTRISDLPSIQRLIVALQIVVEKTENGTFKFEHDEPFKEEENVSE